MHIVCLYFHYASPDCPSGARAYSLLRGLGQKHQVTVFTGKHYYHLRQSQHFDWEPPGVTVRMLDVPYENQMPAARRLTAYASFPAWAGVQASRISSPDLLYAISTPLTTPMAAVLASRIRGIPWVLEIRDLWPDFPIQMGAISSPVLQHILRWTERHLYHDAAHVVTVSPAMTNHVRSTGLDASQVTTLPQGTDLFLFDRPAAPTSSDLRDRHGLSSRHIVLYAGALGRANDLPTLLKAAEHLRHRSDTTFVFIGHGFHEPDVRSTSHRLPNVRYVSAQPRHEMVSWFRLATLSLVSFRDLPVLSTNAPAKLFDSLAASTPVIVTNPGWMTRLIRTHECGWTVPASSASALAEQINTVLDQPKACRAAGERGAELARARFDRAAQVPALQSIFSRAVSAASS